MSDTLLIKDSVFWARDIQNDDSWMDKAIKKLSSDVYITIDLDVFDQSIMSAVGNPEPGGLDWYRTIKFLKKVCEEKNIVGFDIVELNPNDNHSCNFLAAKLLYKLAGYIKT